MTEAAFTSSFGLDPAIEAQLRAIGYALNPATIERSRELFAASKDLTLPPGGQRHEDIAYGDHARHRLDICRTAGDNRPVVLFIPGGGFTGGDKAFYAHIPYFFAREGFVGVGANYRLAPEFMWPCGARDVAAAIDWIARNIAGYGGDPTRIFVVAQSAGAVHAASALFDAKLRPASYESVRAAALMSGLYKIHEGMTAPNFTVYFGDDVASYAERSSVNFVGTSKLPVLVTLAELDSDFFTPQATALMEALNQRDGHSPQFAWLRGHNHLSPVLGMGSQGDLLGKAILAEFAKFA
jgi:acetyl esterase/lipase